MAKLFTGDYMDYDEMKLKVFTEYPKHYIVSGLRRFIREERHVYHEKHDDRFDEIEVMLKIVEERLMNISLGKPKGFFKLNSF